MGKVRVQDLARMMGISNQDLVFKLKSIGVRVEGDDAHIDTDIIQAILQGKKLPHPREVILRDEPTAADVRKRPAATVATPVRRPPANPLRPARPRTLIQKVEPNIRNMPASERPHPAHSFEESADFQELQEMVAGTAAEAPPEMAEAPMPAQEQPAVAASSETLAAPAAPASDTAPAVSIAASSATAPAPGEARTEPRENREAPERRPTGLVAPPPPRTSPPPQRPDSRPGAPGGARPGGAYDGRTARPGGPGGPGGPGARPGGPSGPGDRRPGGPAGPGDRRPGGPAGPGDRRPGGPGGPGGASARPGGPGGPGGASARPGGPGGPGGYNRPGDRPTRPGGSPGDRPPYRPGGQAGDRPPYRPSGPAPTRPPSTFRPGSPGTPPAMGDPSRRRPDVRPGGPERVLDTTSSSADRDKRKVVKKPVKKAGPRPVEEEEDLTTFKGTLEEIEEEVDEMGVDSGRRRRRAARKEEEEQGGKVLTFKKAPPQGPVMIGEGMTIREFAEKLGIKTKDLMKTLFDRGILANINQVLDPELAQELAKLMGVEAMVVSFEEEVQLREELAGSTPAATTADDDAVEEGAQPAARSKVNRAPVVTIMGHVDHGKTSLLDSIRSTKVTESEFGGITQHIGAYHVDVNDRKVVFLDTPGHEAFTMMRARGAKVTDIVVLVVAADDGVMPQTVEAIDHARAAKVPIVVAINKIDKANANPDRVKKELADRGLLPEDWGGDTVMVPVSALKRDGIDELLEMILLTADVQELRANPELSAQGAVLEARKEVGRGIVATVLVQNGTLRIGDAFVSGATWGRVRSMSDDRGGRAKEASPSTPVEVTGFSDLPDAGDLFQVVEDESRARTIAEFRQQETRTRDLAPVQARLSLEQIFNRIQAGEVKELAVVLKADVQGSLEVLRDFIGKASTEKVKVLVLHSGVGAISTNDVLLASASKAVIVGFNVRPERAAVDLAEKEGVDIRLHTVIYELIDELRKAMTGLLEPVFREVASGRAEVRDTFKVPKIGTIAGCHVIDGVIPRAAAVRLLRDNRVIHEGKIASLRRFKDDASEVRAGFDCGIGLERFQDLKPGDIIEAYTREEVAPSL